MILTKIVSVAKETGYQVIKFLGLGKDDTQTAYQATPYGIDSSPVKDMVAVYSPTGVKGESVIIGYINKSQLAEPGEVRLYSTDSDGGLKFYTWLKADGTYEVGGDADNMVRYSKLEEAFNQLKDDHDALVQTFNNHIHITTATVGTGPPGTIQATTTTEQPSTADITPAKIDEIKTI